MCSDCSIMKHSLVKTPHITGELAAVTHHIKWLQPDIPHERAGGSQKCIPDSANSLLSVDKLNTDL